MHVLIADDSAKIRNNLRKLMNTVESVSRISESDDVSSTCEKIHIQLPDVLILDLNMPEGGGFEVLAHLRESRGDMKVVILTNYATDYCRRKSAQLGADYFFDKSNQFMELITLLRSGTI
jgi:DNA-binding NarL/FixJ family response regulator